MTKIEPQFSLPAEATSKDLDVILGWLKEEYAESGGRGFWGNRHRISDMLDYKELWVVRENGSAVAFQAGNYSAEYLSVRKDMRGNGLGALLVEASLQRALRDNVNVLQVLCEPKTSLGFWQKMGFEKLNLPSSDVCARRDLPRHFDLPSSLPKRAVTIEFYPESALYGDRGNRAQPLASHSVIGAESVGGVIYLDRRVFERVPYDAAVKIDVDGDERCFAKAKHDEAIELGMRHDRHGGTYFIDEVRP